MSAYSLKDDEGQWIENAEIELVLYDAGTDDGVSFASADSDNSSLALPITLLSTSRSDSDFENGVHHDNQTSLGTITLKRIK